MNTNTQSADDANQQKKLDKELIKHCDKLLSVAEKRHPTTELKNRASYYYGKFETETDVNKNNFNIIKPLVETKVTYVLDSNITTNVSISQR